MEKIKPVSLYHFFQPDTKEEFERVCTDDEALHYVIHGDYKAYRVYEIA